MANLSKQRSEARIRELLKERLNKLGSIRSDDAWQLCRAEFGYSTVCVVFRDIMQEMISEGRAELLRRGVWWIYRNKV